MQCKNVKVKVVDLTKILFITWCVKHNRISSPEVKYTSLHGTNLI
jgi:hypothetical protein